MRFNYLLFIFLANCIFFDFSIADEGSQKEEFFHQIYQKYHSQPTSQEVWEKHLNERPHREYIITAGDTLWDVSRTLFTDGFFWSKVWSLNPYITNPHQISVGQVIRFYPGSGLDAPGLIVKQEDSAPPALSSDATLSESRWWKSEDLPLAPVNLKEVPLPPPFRKYPMPLENFPSSLPNWYFQTDAEVNKAPLEIVPYKPLPIENILSLPYFISEYPQNIKGTIYEIEKDAKTASERDYIFIEAEDELKIGSVYTVIQTVGKIKDPDAIEDLPRSYEVQGEIIITDKVEELYKAMVTLALFPVQVGAKIIPGRSPKMNLTQAGDPSNLKAMIIGGENDTTRTLFGPQSIVYLNRGSEDGVKLNQRASVMAIHRLRHSDSDLFSNTWKIGEVKIVKVEKHYSTAVVMDATEGIMPGDIVGRLNASDIDENFKKLDSSVKFGDNFDETGRDWKKRDKDDPKESEVLEMDEDDFEDAQELESSINSKTQLEENLDKENSDLEDLSEDDDLLD